MTAQTGRRLRRERRPNGDDGRMSLVEHLRELRSRLFKSLLAITVGTVVGWIFYQRIFDFVLGPFNDVVDEARAQGRDVRTTIAGVTDAFTLQLQVSAMAGVVMASPVWIYQLWRFVTPGLHRHERRWAYVAVAASTPLFLAGVTLAYLFLPKALGLLLGFTPEGVGNYIPVPTYISFVLRMMLVFGLGFLAPVLIVALNFVGLLSAHRFASWWRMVIMATLVFAAVATPSGDPITMSAFAAPLLVLMLGAFVICWFNDRRRAKRAAADGLTGLSDDEASPLDLAPDPGDDIPD